MRSEPVYKHMTVCPHTIGRDQPLSKAKEVMKAHNIRHLPVLDGGVLVGIVSQRDIDMLASASGVDPAQTPVEEAMTPDPFIVSPEESLADVASKMADHKYGAAIVVERGHTAGVFTTVDALRTLAKLLRDELNAASPQPHAPSTPR